MKIKLKPFEDSEDYFPLPEYFGDVVDVEDEDAEYYFFRGGCGWPKSATKVVAGTIADFSTSQLLKELMRRNKQASKVLTDSV